MLEMCDKTIEKNQKAFLDAPKGFVKEFDEQTKDIFTNRDYWTPQSIISRGAMFNYVVGARGVGKSYGTLNFLIKNYLRSVKKDTKNPRRFIYLRRFETDFEDKDEIFKSVKAEFPEYEFEVEGMRAYIRRAGEDEEGKPTHEKQLLCYLIRLSTTTSKKSIPYDDVDYILFEEFILEQAHQHYLRNEVTKFLDFYNTVDRFKDRVRVLFLANAISIVNPYFLYFHIKPRKETNFMLLSKGYICVEVVKNQAYVDHVSKTKFGEMIKDTAYYEYAVETEFKDNSDKFLAKRTEDSSFIYAFKFDGKVLGVYVDYNEGCYFIGNKCPKNANPYVLTKDDMEPNLIMIKKQTPILRTLINLYMQGSVYFDNVQTRELFYDVLDYLALR